MQRDIIVSLTDRVRDKLEERLSDLSTSAEEYVRYLIEKDLQSEEERRWGCIADDIDTARATPHDCKPLSLEDLKKSAREWESKKLG